jgi:hypothetical protein
MTRYPVALFLTDWKESAFWASGMAGHLQVILKHLDGSDSSFIHVGT